MTREEAIRLLDINREYLKNTNNIGLRDDIEALNMAIKALEQEPCDKCEVGNPCLYCKHEFEQEPTDKMVHVETLHQVMWERDIAIEQLHELGYELGQKIEPCDDVVSRQDVLKTMCEFCPVYNCTSKCSSYKHMTDLPSVRPQEQTGKWIDREVYDADRWKCSECGRTEQYK